MSIFSLKIIACVTMFLDHVRYAIPETNCFITKYLGRIAFPLFAFLITEGYTHTKNLKKYYIRLFIFALVSQIPFTLFRTLVYSSNGIMLNIMFTLLLGLTAITIFDKVDEKTISIPLCMFIIYLGKLLNVDYGWYGVLTVFVLFVFRNQDILRIISFSVLAAIYYYIKGYFYFISTNVLLLYFFTVFPLILTAFYKGKLGKKVKYFFYFFYPTHLLLLYFVSFYFK